MKEVITVLGHTHEGSGYREWCVNSAAVDPANKCAVVNSEDGNMYRWDFITNTLSPPLNVALATGEAYTPTLIGPDGACYVINNAGALLLRLQQRGDPHSAQRGRSIAPFRGSGGRGQVGGQRSGHRWRRSRKGKIEEMRRPSLSSCRRRGSR